ncbi:MAG: Fic family protein [Lachnospiraceae bacterium]
MSRKYTEKENIFMVKKLLAELVYNSAYIEGCNVTFPQTQTILDGAVIHGVSVNDIQTVLNLRDSWRFLLQTYQEPLTIEYVCKMNEFVSRNESLQWGTLRTGNVGVAIGEDTYSPKLPEKISIIKKLNEIHCISQPEEQAIEYFAYGCKQQLFWDGNKRTSTLIANKILINEGCGLLSIDKKNGQEFNESLSTVS